MRMGDPRVVGFAEQLMDLAEIYARAMPMARRRVRLGSRTVEVQLPDRSRTDGIDPLDGLIEANEGASLADFELICFDGQGPVNLPMGRWPSDWHAPFGVIRARETSPFRMSLDRHTQTITVFQPGACKAAVWTWDFALFPYWSAATPFRLALSWMADTYDAEFLHGAALVRDSQAVMLVGRSGAGKSTLAFQAIEAGYQLLSDDYFMAESGSLRPVYTRSKLHDSSLPLVGGHVADRVLNRGAEGQKRIIDMADHVRPLAHSGAPLRAVAVPERGRASALRRIAPGEAFRSLAPYSMSGLLGGTSRSLLRMSSTVARKPSWHWNVSQDRDRDLAVLDRLWQASVDD